MLGNFSGDRYGRNCLPRNRRVASLAPYWHQPCKVSYRVGRYRPRLRLRNCFARMRRPIAWPRRLPAPTESRRLRFMPDRCLIASLRIAPEAAPTIMSERASGMGTVAEV
jgi:hypothetical protein